MNALWHSVQHRFAWDIPDHVIMAALVLLISAIVFPLASRRISRDNPGPLQHILELTVDGLKGLLHDIIGHDGDRYLYIIGAFAVFIFISNIFGLFYFLQPPTSNPNTTFALAITSFLYYNYQGIKTQGLLHYLKHFRGPIWWLSPLMFPIEIIGNFARILSLGMRLFGNIFGEHTATGIFMRTGSDHRPHADDGPRNLWSAPADIRLHHADDGVHQRCRRSRRTLRSGSRKGESE